MCVCIGFVKCGCFGNVYLYLLCFVLFVLFLYCFVYYIVLSIVYRLVPPSENSIAVNNNNNNSNN